MLSFDGVVTAVTSTKTGAVVSEEVLSVVEVLSGVLEVVEEPSSLLQEMTMRLKRQMKTKCKILLIIFRYH